MEVEIFRGIPGSGKSTLARKRVQAFRDRGPNEIPGTAHIVSADDWFARDGVYRFDPRFLGEAHADCFRRAIGYLQEGLGLLAVDNTNTSLVEIAPYVALASAFRATHTILTVPCDTALASARNVHGVPEDVILKLQGSLMAGTESMPPWWNHKMVSVAGRIC